MTSFLFFWMLFAPLYEVMRSLLFFWMLFAPLYEVMRPLLFFLSLLMVWGGVRLVTTVTVRVVIIERCRGWGM